MRNLLTRVLFGIAACIWVEGLVMAARTPSGAAFAVFVFFLIGARFGPSVLQGTVRAELAAAFPNQWLRRYLVLFGYFLYALAGLFGATLNWNGSTYVSPYTETYQPYEYSRYYGGYGSSVDWTLITVIALIMPAIFIAAWAQWSRAAGTAKTGS